MIRPVLLMDRQGAALMSQISMFGGQATRYLTSMRRHLSSVAIRLGQRRERTKPLSQATMSMGLRNLALGRLRGSVSR